MKIFWRVLVLLLAFSALVQAQTAEVRVTGEYALAAGDSAETAKHLASLDAGAKVLQRVVASLGTMPSVKSLGLSDAALVALLAGVVELPEGSSTSDGKISKSELVLRLDNALLVRNLTNAAEDEEVAMDLRAIAKRNSQLREKMVAGNRAATALKLQANQLLAQARGAMASQEIGPTSIRITTEAGHALAGKLIDRAMALDSSNADALRVFGDLKLLEDKPINAEIEFREVLKQSPDSGFDHNKLGNALLKQGKLPDAAAEFKEAIRLDPSDFVSHCDLGLVLRQQRDQAGSVAEYREALRINPNYVDAHNNLGIALANQGKIPDALAEFQAIIRLRPNSALGYFNAATALADMERDDESTKALREAVRINPNHYNAHYNLGEMLRLAGELQESAKEFREYVNRAPDTPATQRNKDRAKNFIKVFEEQ